MDLGPLFSRASQRAHRAGAPSPHQFYCLRCDYETLSSTRDMKFALTLPFFARGPSQVAKLDWKQPRFFE